MAMTGRLNKTPAAASVAAPVDWAEACAEFLDHLALRRYSPQTLLWYRHVLGPFERYLCSLQPPLRLEEVTEREVVRFLSQVSAAGPGGHGALSACRLNQYRMGLRVFFEWLHRKGYVEGNPLAGLGKVREPHKLIRALSEAQIEALLRQPDVGRFAGRCDRCFLLLLLDTGLRLSEALGLQVGQLNLSEATLVVLGKGAKERRVALSPLLVAELVPYLAVRERQLSGLGVSDRGWVFCSEAGGRLSSRCMQRRMRGYGQRAGLTGVRVSPHTLRHTFALHFVRRGGDPFTLQRLLGHNSLEITRRYCQLSDADVLARQRELSLLGMLQLTPDTGLPDGPPAP